MQADLAEQKKKIEALQQQLKDKETQIQNLNDKLDYYEARYKDSKQQQVPGFQAMPENQVSKNVPEEPVEIADDGDDDGRSPVQVISDSNTPGTSKTPFRR